MTDIETIFVHAKKGWPVVVSTGIGDKWSVYLRKPNGRLQRCKGFKPDHDLPEEALAELSNYKGSTYIRKG